MSEPMAERILIRFGEPEYDISKHDLRFPGFNSQMHVIFLKTPIPFHVLKEKIENIVNELEQSYIPFKKALDEKWKEETP